MTLSKVEIEKRYLDIERDRKIKINEAYKGTQIKHNCTCLVCQHYWSPKLYKVWSRGDGCPACSGRLVTQSEIEKRYLKTEENQRIKINEAYKGVKLKHSCTCLVCHHGWSPTLNSVWYNGTGCPVCSGRVITPQDLENRIKKIKVRKITLLSPFTGTHAKSRFGCDVCSHEWNAIFHSVDRGQGCPSCQTGGFNPNKPGILYYLQLIHQKQSYFKIGITNRTIEERFYSESTPYDIIWQKRFSVGQHALDIEQSLLKHYRPLYGYKGEKFLVSGNTELFTVDLRTLPEFADAYGCFL